MTSDTSPDPKNRRGLIAEARARQDAAEPEPNPEAKSAAPRRKRPAELRREREKALPILAITTDDLGAIVVEWPHGEPPFIVTIHGELMKPQTVQRWKNEP